MASLCTRCALRLRRAAAADAFISRPFTSTTTRNAHAIPKFTETSNAELDDVLATMRSKHFIPANLTPAQRRLIFGKQGRVELASNPQTIEIAQERIELKWLDRRTEIPNRSKLFRQAVELMVQDGSREAWGNLLQLLIGLRRSGVEIKKMEMERVIRLAIDNGHFDAILQCLARADETSMQLTRPEVLEGVLLGLRKLGQADGWSQQSIQSAMARGLAVAQLLEMDIHGGGKKMKAQDLRRDPRVIGLYLELSAVFAQKHQAGKDVDGRVKAYSERLLYNLEGSKDVSRVYCNRNVTPLSLTPRQITITEPATYGPYNDIMLSIPILHGLKIAQKILAMDMPSPMLAAEVVKNYQGALGKLVQELEQRHPNPAVGGYVGQVLTAWSENQGA